jgi:hypothetical protein
MFEQPDSAVLATSNRIKKADNGRFATTIELPPPARQKQRAHPVRVFSTRNLSGFPDFLAVTAVPPLALELTASRGFYACVAGFSAPPRYL